MPAFRELTKSILLFGLRTETIGVIIFNMQDLFWRATSWSGGRRAARLDFRRSQWTRLLCHAYGNSSTVLPR